MTQGPQGEGKILDIVKDATGIDAMATSRLVLDALTALGMKKVVLLTPYMSNKAVIDYLTAALRSLHGARLDPLVAALAPALPPANQVVQDPGQLGRGEDRLKRVLGLLEGAGAELIEGGLDTARPGHGRLPDPAEQLGRGRRLGLDPRLDALEQHREPARPAELVHGQLDRARLQGGAPQPPHGLAGLFGPLDPEGDDGRGRRDRVEPEDDLGDHADAIRTSAPAAV